MASLGQRKNFYRISGGMIALVTARLHFWRRWHFFRKRYADGNKQRIVILARMCISGVSFSSRSVSNWPSRFRRPRLGGDIGLSPRVLFSYAREGIDNRDAKRGMYKYLAL